MQIFQLCVLNLSIYFSDNFFFLLSRFAAQISVLSICTISSISKHSYLPEFVLLIHLDCIIYLFILQSKNPYTVFKNII